MIPLIIPVAIVMRRLKYNQPAMSRFPSATTTPRRFEAIVIELERAMLSGELVPGQRLPSERELMSMFGVGRGSVREALFALQRMGLVALSAGERAAVTKPTAADLVRGLAGAARQMLAAPDGTPHFQRARMVLECALAREAAVHANLHQLHELRAACDEHRLARNLEKGINADIRFHALIAAMSGNPLLVALHAALTGWLRDQRTISVQITGAKGAAAKAHLRIYQMISSRDADGAALAMQNHLLEVEAYYHKAAAPRKHVLRHGVGTTGKTTGAVGT